MWVLACQLEGLPGCSASIWPKVKPPARPRYHAAADKTVAGLKKNRLCCPTRRRETERTNGCGTGHHQEIRQPAALQYRHEHLRHARRPRGHGEGGRGFHRPRRQDRRGHHPPSLGTDHFRAGEQGGAEPDADRLSAPAHPLLRRQYADAGPALSRSLHRFAYARAGKISPTDGAGLRGKSVRRARGPGAAEHGNVRTRLCHVHAVRAAPHGEDASATSCPRAKSPSMLAAGSPRSTTLVPSTKNARGASIAACTSMA